jgi:tetratricopeptide (TPR) repeat protein
MDEHVSSSGRNEKNEEYIDLVSIFSEEPEEEKDLDSSLGGLEDTVLDNAFKDFQKGIESSIDEQDYETHYNLGIAYKEMGLLPEAIKEFELAFQGDLRFQDASMMLAACYRERGMTTTAIDFLTNALSDPRCMKENLLAMKYELATIYDSEGDKKRAKALYEEVCRLDPTFRDVIKKNGAGEPELVMPIPSIKEERKEEVPKRAAEKKKSKISYL